MNVTQMKMARVALDWGVGDLAAASGVSAEVIDRIERDGRFPPSTMGLLQGALEANGLTFLDGNYSGSGGPGVRLNGPTNRSIDVDIHQVVQYEEYLVNDAPPGAGG
ncbi:XRE family transcriptional regulator [Rhizobium cauense]|nr:XRE family transcriptional regulator [Rhizobium cauense]MBW9118360.1 XRE family transcriptional regulator [Rhizobium cauense]